MVNVVTVVMAVKLQAWAHLQMSPPSIFLFNERVNHHWLTNDGYRASDQWLTARKERLNLAFSSLSTQSSLSFIHYQNEYLKESNRWLVEREWKEGQVMEIQSSVLTSLSFRLIILLARRKNALIRSPSIPDHLLIVNGGSLIAVAIPPSIKKIRNPSRVFFFFEKLIAAAIVWQLFIKKKK